METKTNGRLLSIDVLRGFDMFFITGGAALISALCTAFGAPDGALAMQMRHVPWEGLAHHDTIFPLFLFLAGVSWPFSYASQLAKGRTAFQIYRKVIVRTAILFAFGLSLGGLLKFNPNFRIPSVLGFIGLSWGVAAVVFMNVKRTGFRLAVIAALLLGYWALLSFTLAPDATAAGGHYLRDGNVVSWLDRMVMPNHIYVRETPAYDPESLFSLAGGIAMALLGMTAGAILKSDRTPGAKCRGLLVLFGALLVADLVFIYALGDVIVKALWTPSFVLSAATYSAAMLALFYWIIDVKGWRKWTLYFKVIGMNSITIYMAQSVIGFHKARDFFFSGLAGAVPAGGQQVVLTAGYLVIVWVFLYFLYRKNVFLKV